MVNRLETSEMFLSPFYGAQTYSLLIRYTNRLRFDQRLVLHPPLYITYLDGFVSIMCPISRVSIAVIKCFDHGESSQFALRVFSSCHFLLLQLRRTSARVLGVGNLSRAHPILKTNCLHSAEDFVYSEMRCISKRLERAFRHLRRTLDDSA